MYHIVDSRKSLDQAVADLEQAVRGHGFGVLHVHDLGNTLRSKGVQFSEECEVLEVCNPVQAGKVLATDMRLNMALPCRISVFTEQGTTKIGMIKPVQMLSVLSQDEGLQTTAREVEEKTVAMIEQAR